MHVQKLCIECDWWFYNIFYLFPFEVLFRSFQLCIFHSFIMFFPQ
jgi:hypothetical protein